MSSRERAGYRRFHLCYLRPGPTYPKSGVRQKLSMPADGDGGFAIGLERLKCSARLNRQLMNRGLNDVIGFSIGRR